MIQASAPEPWKSGASTLRDAAEVFAGRTIDSEDRRRDYGEVRIMSASLLRGRMVMIGWTPRGADRHVFSMRKANDREQKKLRPLF